MRKVTSLLGILSVAAFVVAVSTPASATCNPNKTASTFMFGSPSAYWTLPPGVSANEGSLRGQFWQQGNRSAGNEGTYTGWLYFYGPGVNMNAILGDGAVAGCVSGRLITVAQVDSADGKRSFFIAGTVDEISGPAVDFFYGSLGNQQMAEIPRPVIKSSSRVASAVNLTFDIPAAASGAFGPGASTAITGYRLVQGTGTSNADPGRGTAGYTTIQSFTGPAANVPATIDCTGVSPTQDKYVGLQVLFSDGVVSGTSATYRVGCDPSLAAPGPGKIKVIPPRGKPSKGTSE